MPKDTSISIRVESAVKDQVEPILSQLGLNVTTVVNMLFRQIIREKTVPLSLSLNDAATNRKPISRHFGSLCGVFGDGAAYQRSIRDEWE
jgi:addiction module RelB/DinJ family antitoxin